MRGFLKGLFSDLSCTHNSRPYLWRVSVKTVFPCQDRACHSPLLPRKLIFMNQYEAAAHIADEIPEIQKEIVRAPVFGSAYLSVKVLANYTGKMLQQHQLRQVQRCMLLAEKIYNRGNQLMKTAIENVFIFSFSSLRLSCSRQEWLEIQRIMPAVLFSLYIQQVLKPGV